VFVEHSNLLLDFRAESSQLQFHLHGTLIDFLQKTVTQAIMHFEGAPNDTPGDVFMKQLHIRILYFNVLVLSGFHPVFIRGWFSSYFPARLSPLGIMYFKSRPDDLTCYVRMKKLHRQLSFLIRFSSCIHPWLVFFLLPRQAQSPCVVHFNSRPDDLSR